LDIKKLEKVGWPASSFLIMGGWCIGKGLSTTSLPGLEPPSAAVVLTSTMRRTLIGLTNPHLDLVDSYDNY
jgi:hypothetical protein